MARRTYPSAAPRVWPAMVVQALAVQALAMVATAIGGCTVDRTGLESVTQPDGAGSGDTRGDGRSDSPATSTGGNGDGGNGGEAVGLGGAAGDVGAGGGDIDGTGGTSGVGGVVGTGGTIGTGGAGLGGNNDGGPSDGPDGGQGGKTDGGTGEMTTGSGGNADGGTGPDGDAGGAAPADCTPANCANGCCAGKTCITTLTPQQCGHAGGTCQPCAPCDRCSSAGACEVDPASLWDLSAVSALLSSVDPNVPAPQVPAWDLDDNEVGGALPDPFVELDLLGPGPSVTQLAITPSIVDTVIPNWGALSPATSALLDPMGAPLAAGDLMAGGKPWALIVGDDDVGVPGATAGETMCEINGPLTTADFHTGAFTRTDIDSCMSVTFKLACHP